MEVPVLRIHGSRQGGFSAAIVGSAVLHMLLLTISVMIPFTIEADKPRYKKIELQFSQAFKPSLDLEKPVVAQATIVEQPVLPQAQPQPVLSKQARQDKVTFSALKPVKKQKPQPATKNPEIQPQLQQTQAATQRLPHKEEIPGHRLGNVDRETPVIVPSYEALLPLWLKKFQSYPEEARQQKLTGSALLAISIDREGKVLSAKVTQSTGHAILDRELLFMVERASPVIPVPQDYAKGQDILYYSIPFSFELR